MYSLLKIFLVSLLLPLGSVSAAEDNVFPGKKSKWQGFDMYKDGGRMVVVPAKVADGKPWVWRARFFGHQPQFDVALLKMGYHLVYCNVGGLYGSDMAVERWNTFYKYLREERGFAEKAVLEGMSRGGLIIYNWAAANPGKVACIYGDAPVCDFKSWPAGKGKGKSSAGAWKSCLAAYGLTEQEALRFKGNPVDQLKSIAQAKIPILHVVGDADKVVPVVENTAIVEKRYRELGGSIQVIHKPGVGHHPHSLKKTSGHWQRKDVPMGNLYLGLLRQFGAEQDRFGESTSAFDLLS